MSITASLAAQSTRQTARASRPSAGAARVVGQGVKLKSKVPEASDVVALPGNRFLVVGDTTDKVTLMEADGTRDVFRLPGLGNGPSQLEGVAYDPLRHKLFVVREESRELVRYEWNAEGEKAPKLEKTFKLEISGPRNKGPEGLAYLSGVLSPTGRPQLLLAAERSPHEVLMFHDSGKGKPVRIAFESAVNEVCRDFTALAIDPLTGDLFLSSEHGRAQGLAQESAVVAQIHLEQTDKGIVGKLVRSFPVLGQNGETLKRVEGLSFDSSGNLYVLTENDGVMHRFDRR